MNIFVKRGWSKEVLDKYDVGLCVDPKKPMCNRVVVPVYDDKHSWCVGVTGRSIFDKCQKCGLYHDGNCPEKKHSFHFSKWRNSDNFARESYLYNYWYAKDIISREGVAAIVEGPGEIWRLEEAGIRCGLGVFGSTLTDRQQVILEKSGAMTVIVLMNNDEAGKLGSQKIQEALHRSYRLVFPKIPTNDLGDLLPADVASLLNPIIQKHKR